MHNLSKEEKIFVIEYAIENVERLNFICDALRKGLYHYKIVKDEIIFFDEVLLMFPEVTQFCPSDIDWRESQPWFEGSEMNLRIELLKKSLKLLKQ